MGVEVVVALGGQGAGRTGRHVVIGGDDLALDRNIAGAGKRALRAQGEDDGIRLVVDDDLRCRAGLLEGIRVAGIDQGAALQQGGAAVWSQGELRQVGAAVI